MVTCQVCGKQLNWIQNTHLSKHDMTLEEYRMRYPDSPTISEDMHKEIIRTRTRNHRRPIKICVREGCSNPVDDWKNNRYCSCSCSSKDNYQHNLGQYSTKEGNPWYVDGDYSSCKHQKEKAFQRDNGKCIVCGRELNGKEEKYGVHHLIPRRLIKNREFADSLDNLVTLCSKHHKEVESKFADILFNLYINQDYKDLVALISHIKLICIQSNEEGVL